MQSALKTAFTKYAGAGNDFVILDAYHAPIELSAESMKALAIGACNRSERGIGADGLILVESSDKAPFRMRFFNPDGSFGALCGNGARCAVQAAKDFRIVDVEKTEFEVLGAVDHADLIQDEWVRVYFQDPKWMKMNFKIRIGKKDFLNVSYVDLGSQHAVTLFEDLAAFTTDSIENFDIRRFGPVIRWQPDFQPLGANANFIEARGDEKGEYLRIRTFERGVEGETLACGTGCMSSAIVAVVTGKLAATPVRLLTQSGEFVYVGFERLGDQISNLWLEGSAVRGKTGELSFEEKGSRFEYSWQK